MAIDTHSFFLVIGLVIVIGFFGRLIKQRVFIPESLLLIAFGILLGPVLGIFPRETFYSWLPHVSVAAMVAVLIESGIEFDISKLRSSLLKAGAFTLMVACLTTILIGAILIYFFEWNLWEAALVGVISSGTTTITAMSLLNSIRVGDKLKKFILLETILNDFTIIIGTFMIVELIKLSDLGLSGVAGTILSEFSVAVTIAIIVSIGWRHILTRISQKKELSYASTMGICFLLYYFADYVGGNAIIAIFTFTLLLGNYSRIYKFIIKPKKKDTSMDRILRSIKSVQTDMTFFLASSFFVLLGVTFQPELFITISPLIIICIVLSILAARYFSASLLSFFDKELRGYQGIITVMIPRGYVAAILAFVPAEQGIDIPLITDIVLILILTTTMIAIIGTFIYSRFNHARIPNHLKRLSNKRRK